MQMQHTHSDNAVYSSSSGAGVGVGNDEDDVDLISNDDADAKQFTRQNDNLVNKKYATRLSVAHPNDRNDRNSSSLSFREFRRSLSILKRSIREFENVDKDNAYLLEEDDDNGNIDSEGLGTSGDNGDDSGRGECPTFVPSYLRIVNHHAEEEKEGSDHPSSYALHTSVRVRNSLTRKSMIPVTGDCERRNKLKWLKSFYHLDPRWQICRFFEDLAYEGVEGIDKTGRIQRSGLNLPSIMRAFSRVGVFSVWRPTSNEAIRRMIMGTGTGKGMDIKGKSAIRGKWSGFVPFLQIHRNEDKLKVGSLHADGRVRVFYPNKLSRNRAFMTMSMVREKMIRTTNRSLDVINEIEKKQAFALDVEMHKSTQNLTHCTQPAMRNAIRNARRRLSTVVDYSRFQKALEEVHHNSMIDDDMYKIDDYASSAHGRGCYGLELPEKLFWKVFVSKTDISREAGSDYDTGRASMPEFQTMNLESLRKAPKAGPRPVLWHAGCGQVGEEPPQDVNPLCPFGLLMAYEEGDKDAGKVTPVVSDFDCFLVGTRGVEYRDPLGDKELSMLKWCVDEIEGILDNNKDKEAKGTSCWTRQWLDVKKKYAFDPRFQTPMPKMGYADPRGSALMKGAVYSLRENGAVRHGPEAFNYSFPQPLDEKFLVISDTLGTVPWKYVDIKELKEILSEKINDGFAFPLNPKWILCDEGWKDLYDKLLASEASNVQEAMHIWYPADVRERIAAISSKHPIEFESSQGAEDRTTEGLAAMKQNCLPVSRPRIDGDEFLTDLAELELERYKHARRGRAKLRRALLKKKEKKAKKFSFFSSVLLMLRMGKKNDAPTTTTHTEVAAERDSIREKSGITKLRNRLRRKSISTEYSSASSIASVSSDRTQSGSRSEHNSALTTTIASFPSERSVVSQGDGKGNHDERPSRRRSSWFQKMGRGSASR